MTASTSLLDLFKHFMSVAESGSLDYRISGLAYLRETVNAITEGREPDITGSDGLRAIEVVEAIYESAHTGRAVDVAYQDLS